MTQQLNRLHPISMDQSVMEIRCFVLRRLFRLYPLHFITFFLTMAVTIGGNYLRGFTQSEFSLSDACSNLIQSLLLVQALGFSMPSYNPASWSISAELWSYLVFALVVLGFGRVRSRVLVMTVVGSVSFGALLFLNNPKGLYTALEFGFLRCISGFSLGVLVWYAWRMTSNRPNVAVTTALLGALFATLLAAIYVTSSSTNANTVLLPIFASLIYVCSLDQGSVFKKVLESSVATSLGRLSYSIYMLHSVVGIVVSFSVTRFAPHLKGVPQNFAINLFVGDAFCIVYLTITILIATQTFKYVEDPMRRFGNRLASSHGSKCRLARGSEQKP